MHIGIDPCAQRGRGRAQRMRRVEALCRVREELLSTGRTPNCGYGETGAPGGVWSSPSRWAAARIWIGVSPRRASFHSRTTRFAALVPGQHRPHARPAPRMQLRQRASREQGPIQMLSSRLPSPRTVRSAWFASALRRRLSQPSDRRTWGEVPGPKPVGTPRCDSHPALS